MSDDTVEDGTTNDSIKDLRKAADEGRRASAEAEALRRELAFAKAGIDTDSKLGKLLFKSYDGELSAEAIRAEASDLGMLQPAATERVEVPAEERDLSRARMELASEAGTPAANEENPFTSARSSWEAARQDGAPLQDAFAAAMNPLLQAAHRNDPRVSQV